MIRSWGSLSLLLALVLIPGGQVFAADAPVLLASNPASGSVGISPQLGGILLVFDRPMDHDSHSFVLSEQGEFPALDGDAEWFNERTMFLPVKGLTPGKTYGVGLNSDRHQGFKSAAGVPLAPVSIHFTVSDGFPAVVGSDPRTGFIAVETATGRVVIKFSEDVKAGRMSLIRLAGTKPLGYIPGKQPFFHDARTLVIPVKLEAKTTYGVGVNGPGRFGFVSASSGNPVQPFQLVFTTGEGKAPPISSGLVGHWKYTAPDGEIQVKLNADGTYQYYLRGPEGEDRTQGTWSAAGGKLKILEQGESKPLILDYRQESANQLTINMGGDLIPFQRVGGDSPPPDGPTIYGRWFGSKGDEEVLLILGRDGRYIYRGKSAEGTEAAAGTWKIDGGRLVVTQDGGAESLRVPFKMMNENTLEVELEGQRFTLSRQPDNGVPPPTPPSEDRLHGSILFVRYEVIRASSAAGAASVGAASEILVPQVHCMYFNGSETNLVLNFGEKNQLAFAQDPWWSPDGTQYLWASDLKRNDSALYMDVWWANRDKSGMYRITGNSREPTDTGKTGSIKVTATAGINEKLKGDIQWQGHKGKMVGDTIVGVPAGKIWVKGTANKFLGDLQFVDVPPDGVADVTLNLMKGNYLATYPSMTPDGKYVVCLSQHAYYEPGEKKRSEGDPKKADYEFDRLGSGKGVDTVAVVRKEDGMLLALWDPRKHAGAMAKDPRLSPDGKWIAFAMGTPGMEALAVMSLEKFLAGKEDPRILVPGDRVLGAGIWSNVSPAWSPDGKQIVFARCYMTTKLKGNLCVVSLDGGPYRQLTNLDDNQLPAYPSWSPYNEGIAFQLITGKSGALDLLDIPQLNFTSDICVVGVDGSNPRKYTSDGRSASPAWGPYPR